MGWTLVLPVKHAALAKSRLAPPAGIDRTDLARGGDGRRHGRGGGGQFQPPVGRAARGKRPQREGRAAHRPGGGGSGPHAAIIIEAMSCTPAFRLRARVRATLVQAGFTLIELMVVLVIIGVLAALIVPNVLERADDARVTAARTDVNNLMQALKLYKLDNQRYPTSEQGLQALVTRPSAGPAPANWKPYLDKLPNDPWGRPYQYLNPGVKGEIDVMSFGADGQAGGEGKNADVGSWQ
jgi:general secretion pathway protein G